MLTKIMKWLSMGALLTAALLWGSTLNSQLPRFLLGCVVCLGAGMVIMQAVPAKRYLWASGFAAMALLFNPLSPILPFGWAWGRLLVLLSIAAFALSLATLKAQTLLSVASITDRNPGSQSL